MLNPSKTQFVLLRRPGTELPPGTAVNCRGTSIVPSAYARYLGILVDEHLSFSAQVDAVCANVNRKVGAFVHAKQNISIFGKRLFYLSIIQSTFQFPRRQDCIAWYNNVVLSYARTHFGFLLLVLCILPSTRSASLPLVVRRRFSLLLSELQFIHVILVRLGFLCRVVLYVRNLHAFRGFPYLPGIESSILDVAKTLNTFVTESADRES